MKSLVQQLEAERRDMRQWLWDDEKEFLRHLEDGEAPTIEDAEALLRRLAAHRRDEAQARNARR